MSAAATRRTLAILTSTELIAQPTDDAFIEEQTSKIGPLVTLLPGSRTQEIKANLRDQLKAAQLISQRVPNARFAIAGYKTTQWPLINSLVARSKLSVDVHIGRTPELIRAARCCLAVSGSGVAGVTVPRQADGDPVSHLATGVLGAETLSPGPLYHAR